MFITYINKSLKATLLCLLCFVISSNTGFAQETDTLTAKKLTLLSFEDLMQVKIKSASFISIEKIKTPASITIISKEQIEMTPFRDLLDILEVYVPSMTFVSHWNGSRMGMRGIMGDQNNSFLLLIDGQPMNTRADGGAVFEIQNRDLSEIEKIVVIRGPGSVVHGPGAIAGVVSITTKNEEKKNTSFVGMEQNLIYRYSTLNTNYSLKRNKFTVSLSGSYSTSQGIENPEYYYIDRAHGYGYGYMSDSWGNKGTGSAAPNIYNDFDNRPQIKLNARVEFLNELSFSARYSTLGITKLQQSLKDANGPTLPGIYGQQITAYLEDNHKFSEQTELKTSVGFQSQSLGSIAMYQGDKEPMNDITQMQNAFSENKIVASTMLSFKPFKKLDIAVGGEYNYWFYGPQWGKEKNSFLMDFTPPVRFAVADSSSKFYQTYNSYGLVTLIEDKITANQISGFVELNYKPHSKTNILVSTRFDKHNLADVAFSPRLALIQQIGKKNFVKAIAQQSVRLPNFRELYAIEYSSAAIPDPEKLHVIELIYSRIQGDNLMFNLTGYYQQVDQIAWFDEAVGSSLVGTFESMGMEADVNYKRKKLDVSLAYSFIHQLGWEPKLAFQSYLTNIGADSVEISLDEAGVNRINNFPKHQLKFVVSYGLFKNFRIHFNGRFAAAYGQVTMLDMFNDAHQNYGTQITKEEMTAIYNDLMDKGYGKPSFTSNLLIRYRIPVKKVNLYCTAYAMNLFAINHIRYVYQYWETENNRQYPRQAGFVNEPTSLGLKLSMKY